jgi:hypothetical protein
VTSQIKLIPTPSWFVYFVLKAQPVFINFGWRRRKETIKIYPIFSFKRHLLSSYILSVLPSTVSKLY